MEKEQSNRLDQIRLRQEQLEKDHQKTLKEKHFFKSFPPIGREIVSKIIMNQNKTLVNHPNQKESLEKYLKTTYCVPTMTKNKYQEETQS